MMRSHGVWTVLVLLACAASARAEETLEQAARYLDDTVRQYRTIRYQVEVNSEMTVGGVPTRSFQQMDHEILRLPDGRAKTRYQARSITGRQSGGSQPQVEESSSLSVFDGRYLWDMRETPQRIYAIKSEPRRNPYDPIGRLEQAREQFQVRLLPERTYEGKEVYAFEFRAREEDPNAAGRRMVSYMDRKTGLPIATISYDAGGNVTSMAKVVSMQLNEDMPADHFVFHTPPGVELVDATKEAGAASSGPATRAAATQSQPASRPAR